MHGYNPPSQNQFGYPTGGQSQQAQLLLLELLRQNNMAQLNPRESNNNSSIYGSGFMGAQHLLSQQPSSFMQNSNQQNGGNFATNLNNIYANLSSYQSMIDQIERGNQSQFMTNQTAKSFAQPDYQQKPSFEPRQSFQPLNESYDFKSMPDFTKPEGFRQEFTKAADIR